MKNWNWADVMIKMRDLAHLVFPKYYLWDAHQRQATTLMLPPKSNVTIIP